MIESIGKIVAEHLYVHSDALAMLDAKQQEQIGKAVALANVATGKDFNVVKLNQGSTSVSLLDYPGFFEEAFPVLRRYWTVDLAQATVRFRSYAESLNPPILHRKELLLPKSHPAIETFAKLTQAAEQVGLFDDPRRIGFLRAWEALLALRGYRVIGHELVPLGNDESTSVTENGSFAGVARHLTALSRTNLSAPMQTLARLGWLDGSKTVFDYGCGRGGDVRGLAENGIIVIGDYRQALEAGKALLFAAGRPETIAEACREASEQGLGWLEETPPNPPFSKGGIGNLETPPLAKGLQGGNTVELIPPPIGGRLGEGQVKSSEDNIYAGISSVFSRPHPSPPPLVEGTVSLNSTALGEEGRCESQSLQLHTSLIPQLPPVLRVYVACGLKLYGDPESADLIKIHIRSGKLTLLRFDDFLGKPLPRLLQRVKLKLREQDFDVFEYGGENAANDETRNPPTGDNAVKLSSTVSSSHSNAIKLNRHTGMDCRYPEHREVNLARPPWPLGSGIPCRNDEENLNPTVWRVRAESTRYTPPYLYRKSRYLNEEMPNYPEQLAFDEALENLNLFNLDGYGPKPSDFDKKLKAARWAINGFSLVRSRTIPELDSPCGDHFTYRQFIECGETQAQTGLPNLPKQPDSYTALHDLAVKLLDPLIDYYGPVKLTYGFSSPELARRITGRIAPKLDQHAACELNRKGEPVCPRLGAAVDFIVEDEDMEEVARWVIANLPYDRLYYYGKDRPIHVSYSETPAKEAWEMRVVGERRVPRVFK